MHALSDTHIPQPHIHTKSYRDPEEHDPHRTEQGQKTEKKTIAQKQGWGGRKEMPTLDTNQHAPSVCTRSHEMQHWDCQVHMAEHVQVPAKTLIKMTAKEFLKYINSKGQKTRETAADMRILIKFWNVGSGCMRGK